MKNTCQEYRPGVKQVIRIAGETALVCALVCAFVQSVLPIAGYYRRNPYLLASARPTAIAQCLFVLSAYVLLTIAFACNDFSITYVAANSHPLLPLMYRLTALWGAHEGSILLWIMVLNCWTLVFAFFPANRDYDYISLVIAVLGIISFCFLVFLFFTSNPFLAAPPLLTGNDLNPLLQDPGFVIHPPMLYIGYVGFSVAFAMTQAALLRGKLDIAWATLTRKFAIAAWCFLTLGITLGSWWAYRVLGWGGFWFWDPVENASLLPWLAGTALIHVLLLVEKRNVALSWAALLAIITFALSLLGTFLVRSGVLISAHTFASDPTRGTFLLLLLTILLSAAIILYVLRLPILTRTAKITFSLLSRETSLLINSCLLFIAMLTILLGTLYPLILDALQLGTISVGAPYFNSVMAPLILIIMTFMGMGPLCQWQQQSLAIFLKRTAKNMALSLSITLLLLWAFTTHVNAITFISLTLSLWIIISVIPTRRILPGMTLAHSGFAVLIIGIMLSSVLMQEREVRIKPGDTVNIGPYQFLFIDTQGVSGANYRGIRGEFEVTKATRYITNMYPEKRIYTVRDMVMTNVAIDAGIFRDLYIALGEPIEQK
jgi:cytochrome c-type biogenesis protein CcmF